MTPLKGVVVGTNGVLTIRLPSRALVEAPRHKDIRLGDTCYVSYDYTAMRTRSIMTESEYHSEDHEPEIPSYDEEEPDWLPPHELASSSDGWPVVSL